MKKVGCLLLFTILIFIDRLTKYVVIAGDIAYDNGSFFGIHLSYNRGISWGIFHSSNSLTFTLVSAAIVATLSYFMWYAWCMYRAQHSLVAFVFVIAGAVSNFIDRVWYGGVVDFIMFYWKQYCFPIFNLADVWIFCGIAYILFFQYRESCNIFVKK